MVFTELKEITKSKVFGCGEDFKFQWNGNNIKVTTISLSQKWIQLKKLIKRSPKNIGLTFKKDKWLKEDQYLTLCGSNESIALCKHIFIELNIFL
jgi:hypothetical protein